MRKTGTILFNEIFVNENNVYNPQTGEILDIGWALVGLLCVKPCLKENELFYKRVWRLSGLKSWTKKDQIYATAASCLLWGISWFLFDCVKDFDALWMWFTVLKKSWLKGGEKTCLSIFAELVLKLCALLLSLAPDHSLTLTRL